MVPVSGRQWRESLLLVFPAAAVWMAVIEAGDMPRDRALVWGWFLAGMAAGAGGGALYGVRSPIAPPTEAQRGCASSLAFVAAI
jgi:hypothetical protein